MPQLPALISTLKQELKAKGKTYSDVARHMRLSEASVKRMFSAQSFTLERLEAICLWIDLEISDLVHRMNEAQHKITHLTQEQESALVNNEKLLLVAVCVRNFYGFDDILQRYEISQAECIGYLAQLDKWNLIELLPGNRIRLRTHADFRWLKDGPIERHYRGKIEAEFLDASFQDDHEARQFISGPLCKDSVMQLQKRINQLANEFSDLRFEERTIPPNEKSNTGLLIAMRSWELSAFKSLRKP